MQTKICLILLQDYFYHFLITQAWIASFEKPKVTPNSLFPSPTGVSPYLRFGCLSPRLFYHRLAELYRKVSDGSSDIILIVVVFRWYSQLSLDPLNLNIKKLFEFSVGCPYSFPTEVMGRS